MLSFFIALAICCSVGVAQANLISNGSFETPFVPVGGFTNFRGGANLQGWEVVGVNSALVNTMFTDSDITFNAQSGNQWIDLGGLFQNSRNSGIRQSFPTTSGQQYEVSFYVGGGTDGRTFFPTLVDLSLDFGPRVSFFKSPGPGSWYMLNWELFRFSFTAENSSTTLTFYHGAERSNFKSALDNVTVVAIPEPSIVTLWVVLGSTLGWYFLYQRHTKR
ncbi:MAG: DUF642 domain-containing protein [Pirellulales bacterium]|nr:DUF642 domain-containing protein [Pirellulales bacterium]